MEKALQKKHSGPVQFGPYTRSLVSNTRHPDKPANNTNRDCWVFKQAGKLIAENKDKGPHNDDEEEPRQPNTGGQKRFPPQVRMVIMIYATHIPKRERKRALRDVNALEPVAPKFNPWFSCPITFDHRDHPTSIRLHWS